jgi:hypothetical protein
MKISRLVPEEEYKRLLQCSLTQHQQHEPSARANVNSEHVESVQTLLNETGESLKPPSSRGGEHDHMITLLTSAFPPKHENRVKRLFEFLANIPEVTIKPNGAMKVGAQLLQDTHYIDFIKDALYPIKSPAPASFALVYEVLRKENVPSSFILNPYRKKLEKTSNTENENKLEGIKKNLQNKKKKTKLVNRPRKKHVNNNKNWIVY